MAALRTLSSTQTEQIFQNSIYRSRLSGAAVWSSRTVSDYDICNYIVFPELRLDGVLSAIFSGSGITFRGWLRHFTTSYYDKF